MWSLPEINSLNARAKSCATAYDKETKLKTSKKHSCECCGKPSTRHEKYFDIFSDDAKGVRHLCEPCSDQGRGEEGYFECCTCNRLMVENYTWEKYAVEHPDGLQCLACAAKDYFSDPDNQIDPAKVTLVFQDPDGQSCLFDSETGRVNLCRVKHVLGVKQPEPKGVKYIDNFENCNERGLFDCAAILAAIKEQTSPVYLVLDGAYQFSVSIGLYKKD